MLRIGYLDEAVELPRSPKVRGGSAAFAD